MGTITTEMTFKYTKDLAVLYVEDDKDLQIQTSELFETLFKSVTTANNGVEALDKYTHQHYDLIVTDIMMQKMSGIELTKEIKKININTSIIVTSSHNEVEYLMELLNLGIKHFIQKPMEKENILEVLYIVAKTIKNEQMVENYRKDLELKNIALKTKNDELQSLLRILDSKLTQAPKEDTAQKNLDFSKLLIAQSDLNELTELEQDISGAAILVNLSKNLTNVNIQVLGKMFLSYANRLMLYKDYEPLTTKIEQLGNSLNNAPESFIKRVEDISILLESFIYVLKMWRVNIEQKDIKKAFDLHASMINDINTIIIIIDDKEDEIQTEMEFF